MVRRLDAVRLALQPHCATGRAHILGPARRIVHAGTQADCLDLITRRAPSAGRRKTVVLLHAILNYPGIMRRPAVTLEEAGWALANFAHPSRRLPIAAHAAAASRAADALARDGASHVSCVGHSLIARAAIARSVQDGWQPGRLVLIGSPVDGSAMARTLRRLPGYETLLDECGLSLAASCETPATIAREVAVIAGGTGGRGFSPLLPGDNDFTVTVAETRLPGAESLLVSGVHNVLPERLEDVGATLRFPDGNALASVQAVSNDAADSPLCIARTNSASL